ncbi:MAG: SDR family oxidoreductase [Saprospiraceae bacterium]|nr:SDR family oxidoreductase [Saprospiraceae bacterium]MBK6566591.1 SDR family oxidoreductase [Saprospiraceae bacterium]MBK8549316.1 SDR family oxidoreductase [Saprospiraceae bacterium]MBK9043859.1 SDR family oxidoreductase [Saprospiraceae bacterium]
MWAVVTGATKGIGLAIAEKMAENGVNLIVCSRNIRDLEDMKTGFAQKFKDVALVTCRADLSKKQDIQTFANIIREYCDSPDILVNNAGTFIAGSLADEPEENLPMMMETNVYSAYYLTKHLLTAMKARQKGHIINICSIASKIAYPNGGSYSISKFALLGFSKVLREELKSEGIKVTAILPGATWSDSWKGTTLPPERLMEAKDIASSVWNIVELGPSCVVEEIILRPQLGDL